MIIQSKINPVIYSKRARNLGLETCNMSLYQCNNCSTLGIGTGEIHTLPIGWSGEADNTNEDVVHLCANCCNGEVVEEPEEPAVIDLSEE